MKKSLKIKTTVTMALVACFSLVFGLTMLASPATTAKADAPATFEMLGASVRYETAENANDNGIRFGVQLDKTAYAALTADENAEAGILICPEDQYTGSLVVGTAKATKGVVKGEQGLENVMIGTWTENAGGYMQTWVYMTGIPEESFNRPISGRAYIDWNGDASDVSYSDTVTKAIADVALAVREDYEGENVYETTAEQYASLDDYLLNYDVKFIDAYGNEATQSVKYGDNLEVADDPATRTGYTFTGWYEKNGESAYSATATDFNATNAKKVKYARTFKPGFNTNGTTFEKPAIGVGHARAVAKGLQGDTSVTDGVLSVRGAYYFDGAEVDNGSDYLVQMTFTANGGDIWFALSDDQAAGYGRIEYRTGKDQFYIYNYTSGTYRGVAWDWYDCIEQRSNAAAAIVAGNEYTMTMVHKNGKYTVFINGVKATEFSESEELTMWGSKSDPVKHVTDIVGDGEKVYVGIGSINATTAVADWRYSVDAETIETFVPCDESPVANFASDLSNGVFTNNNGTNNNNPQFEVQATFAYNAAIDHYGFKFQQVGNGTSTVFAYDATNGYFGYYKNGNKASDWREFRITNYSKDTFTANA
ncbi:MAG TPA: hypothetical protein DDW54_04195 [Clostridiales bacterium]|nr:hypothetical protein [Clostridiales bacterium]